MKLRSGLFALVLTVALLGGRAAAEPVAGQTDDPNQALLLDKAYAGHLDPGRDGHFAYYRFYYPADGSTATVNVQIYPDDATVLANAGIKLFGPRQNHDYLTGTGQQIGRQPNVSVNVISTDTNDRGFYTVQLYNYNWTTPIDFTIEAVGAAAVPTPVGNVAGPAATPTPSNLSAAGAIPLGADHQDGTLPPNGREFRYYRFSYAGDGSTASVNMQVAPDDPTLLRNVGFQIYGPRFDMAPMVAGIRHGLVPNLSRDVIGTVAGTYVVQVYNYDRTRWIQYSIWVAGLPTPTPIPAP
jgi:hypothetical protein